MNELSEVLMHTPPQRIIYTTYTKAGAQEAIDRAVKQFKLDSNSFPHFRTLHSLCYRNMRKAHMMKAPDYRDFGKQTGFNISPTIGVTNADGTPFSGFSRGDQLIALNNLQRQRMCDYEEACDYNAGSSTESPATLKYFSETLTEYKKAMGKIDFTDMLERFLEEGQPIDVDYVFGDEAQDFTNLQWKIMDLLSIPAKKLFYAGDDKQSIYEFAGGCPQTLIGRQGNRIVLDKCYRLPSTILDFAERVADRITEKTPYEIEPIREGGTISEIRSLEGLPLREGTWLLLARNRVFLEPLEKELVSMGILFKSSGNNTFPVTMLPAIRTWDRLMEGGHALASEVKVLYKDYLPAGTRIARGFKKVMKDMDNDELLDYEALKDCYGLLCCLPWDLALDLPPNAAAYIKKARALDSFNLADNIEVTTIHSTKGREADNVVVVPDMTGSTWRSFERRPDSEHRTFYVAATRARENLYLMQAYTDKAYTFPTLK